jgi:hypothetical protein
VREILLLACAVLSLALPFVANATPQCDAGSPAKTPLVPDAASAPRVIALHGSVPIVTMEPFADFLEAMGYPPDRLAHNGRRTTSSRIDSRRLAGELAWHYERDGVMPVVVGHSQGGMVVIRMLHDLAGTRGREPIPVWNPASDAPEPRTTIVDPRTRATREVADLRIEFAAALATGSLPRIVLGQWGMLPLLRDVPDSVRRFTGFAIPFDPIAGTLADPAPFHATGSAEVRNVVLPTSTSHIGLPNMAHLAQQPATRAWIEAYRPDGDAAWPANADVTNLVQAAELWFAIRRAWCESAQRSGRSSP